MAMNVRDYLRDKCSDMLAIERDVARINAQLAQEVQNPILKDTFQNRGDCVQAEINNLETIVNRLGGTVEKQEGFLQKLGVGSEWGSTFTKAVMSRHDDFANTNPPQNLIDLNDAIAEEEITHFSLADYTGLIVMAKQLGETEVANLLQQNIDCETSMRTKLESQLPVVFADLSGPGTMAA